MPDITRAISIRQPFVEQILLGIKRKEYRSVPTNIRERVWLYASARPHEWKPAWKRLNLEPGDLPTRMILGTVEIVDCIWDKRYDCWAYVLKDARRLKKPLVPKNQPNPVWWRPRF